MTNPMTVDAIARLAGLTGDTAVVRERKGEDGPVGEPLSGSVPIKNGEHFVVTPPECRGRLPVTPEVRTRLTRELENVSWKTKLVEGPDVVIYYGLPSTSALQLPTCWC